MKRILITNDDGIEADGLLRLAKAAQEFGDVWIVAPDGQRSAASHSITLHAPIDVHPVSYELSGVKAFACSGSPADCVRVGSLFVMPEKPDVVLSGVNFGYNVASDIQYSATAGAAFEGAFQGCLSIAFSEGIEKDEAGHHIHEVTDAKLPEIIAELMDGKLSYGQIYNVNFPSCRLSEWQGIKRNMPVSHGMFFHDRYNEIERLSDGGFRLMVEGLYNEETEENTDMWAVLQHYISVGIVENIGR